MFPAVMYHLDDFYYWRTRKGRMAKTLRTVEQFLERNRKAVKKAVDHQDDNDHSFILDSRAHPALMVSCTAGCFTLWTASGFHLGQWDHVPEDLTEMADHAGAGEFCCDECKQWFPLAQVQRYGFCSGVCKTCYDPKKHRQPSTRGDN